MLILGGTKGIGKACVERFVKDGYEVDKYIFKLIIT